MGQTRYPSKTWVFKSRFSFKIRQHSLQQPYLQHKVWGILYKMVSAPSFSQPYLCIQPPLQSQPKIWSSTSANFHLPILALLFNKIILTIPTNTRYLYTSALFHLPIFTYKHPSNQHKKYFPYFSYLVCSDCVKGPRSYGVLCGITLFQSLPSSSKYGQW